MTPRKWMKHRRRLVRIWLIHKPIAASITLSRFIHLSHKCPVGLFHHIFQHLPDLEAERAFCGWEPTLAQASCQGAVPRRLNALLPAQPCASQHGLLLFGSQRPSSVFLCTDSVCRQGSEARFSFYFKLYIQRLWYYLNIWEWVRDSE